MFFVAGLVAASFAQTTEFKAQRGGLLTVFEPEPCWHTHEVRQEAFPAARASSALTEGAVQHGPERAIDGSLSTAWVEGVEGAGHGESLRLKLSGEGQVPDGLWVVPGYAKDAARWGSNRRVSVLEVRFLKAPDGVSAEDAWALDQMVPTDTEPMRVILQTEGGVVPQEGQAISVGAYFIQNMESTQVIALDVVIIETDGTGARYEDTCLSEVAQLHIGEIVSTQCNQEWCVRTYGADAQCP